MAICFIGGLPIVDRILYEMGGIKVPIPSLLERTGEMTNHQSASHDRLVYTLGSLSRPLEQQRANGCSTHKCLLRKPFALHTRDTLCVPPGHHSR